MQNIGRILLLFFMSFAGSAGAQTKYYQSDTSIKVYAYGNLQTLAWCGGFNNPQFAMADLNHDGLTDLVVFEPWNSLRTFLNVGSEGNPQYRYAPEYEVNFPPLLDYMVLADYNCDGIPDLFHQGEFGFAVYRGYYNEYNQLAFKFYKDLFYNNDCTSPGPVNAFDNPSDIPAIVDVDNDGDLDFIAYNIVGGNMNMYKNYRVELGLPCDSIVIGLYDRTWGMVSQGFYRTHTFPVAPDTSCLRTPKPKSGEKKTHMGNTPCLFDYDMDGDYDYLDGSVSFNEMTFLKNGRIPYDPAGRDSMIYQDTMWQSLTGGTQIEIPIWPAAFNIDIDQDGKKDLLVAPNTPNLSENYYCVWFYKNYTTPGNPDWRFQSDSFLVDKSIDLGTAAYPTLFDINKDGKPDMIVGSDGYYTTGDGSLRSRLSYYQNTSTTGHPSLTLQTKDYLGLSSYGFKGIAPAFGDIDNDGINDLIIGHSDGTLSYLKNIASTDTAQPNFVMNEVALTDEDGTVINVGGHAAPFIYDMDLDGKKDLIIGNIYGTIVYYQNVSTTPGSIKLKLITKHLGNVHADSMDTYGVMSTPFIGVIDSTNVKYLLVGGNSGNIYRYTGFQTGDTSAIYTMLDTDYSFIDSTYSIYSHSGTQFGYYGNHRPAPTVGDIAGDGTLTMLVGDNKGGIECYKARPYVPFPISHVGVLEVNEQGNVSVFPNPSRDVLNVSWNSITQPEVQISLINMEGQTLYTTSSATSANKISVSVDRLPSGMYVCVLQSGVNRYYSKFTVVK